jgi:hypothetical protein
VDKLQYDRIAIYRYRVLVILIPNHDIDVYWSKNCSLQIKVGQNNWDIRWKSGHLLHYKYAYFGDVFCHKYRQFGVYRLFFVFSRDTRFTSHQFAIFNLKVAFICVTNDLANHWVDRVGWYLILDQFVTVMSSGVCQTTAYNAIS